MGITRAEIVDAALRLLDQEGLEGVTLRRVAAELGVQAPTLYWHVRNKRELLDLMAQALVAAAVPDPLRRPRPGQEWWEWLSERTTAAYSALAGRRDAALVVAGNRPTPEALPGIEASLEELVAAGFPPEEALHIFLVLGSFAAGCAVEQQQLDRRTAEDHEADRAVFRQIGGDDRFPILRAIVAGATGDPNRDSFEVGLRWLLAGLRARLAELVGSPPPR